MENGASLVAPETVFLSADTVIGKDVIIEPNVVIGPGVVIEDGATIKSFCHLERAHVGPYATVGPFARLRPGAKLAKNAHVGNFVEIKQSDIGEGAKVNHLTYIGDSSVGAAANIGAGTITCNYDGFEKHRTEIGAGAFIGSNSSPDRAGQDRRGRLCRLGQRHLQERRARCPGLDPGPAGGAGRLGGQGSRAAHPQEVTLATKSHGTCVATQIGAIYLLARVKRSRGACAASLALSAPVRWRRSLLMR